MDADAISRLDYAAVKCRETSADVPASFPKGVIGNYHSIMIGNCARPRTIHDTGEIRGPADGGDRRPIRVFSVTRSRSRFPQKNRAGAGGRVYEVDSNEFFSRQFFRRHFRGVSRETRVYIARRRREIYPVSEEGRAGGGRASSVWARFIKIEARMMDGKSILRLKTHEETSVACQNLESLLKSAFPRAIRLRGNAFEDTDNSYPYLRNDPQFCFAPEEGQGRVKSALLQTRTRDLTA